MYYVLGQMYFKVVFLTQTVKMERLPAPLEGLVALRGLIHLVEGVSMSLLCVMVYWIVLVALMKWTVDPVRSFIAMNLIIGDVFVAVPGRN